MNQNIPHASDLLPRNPGSLEPGRLRKSLHGFADDLQVANDRVLDNLLLQEGLFSAGGVRSNLRNTIGDVPQINQIVLHSGTASAKIRSARYGLTPPGSTTSTGQPN